jgi:hypothetical protein
METTDKLGILKSIVETVEGNLTAEDVKSKIDWIKLNCEKESGVLGIKYTIEFELWK